MKKAVVTRRMALSGMAALGVVAAFAFTGQPAAAEDVVVKVYTAIEEEQMPPYKEAFESWQAHTLPIIAEARAKGCYAD